MYISYNKLFGYHCKYLADESGVPWEIAVVAGHIRNYADAIKLLCNIREARSKVTDNDVRLLTSKKQETVKNAIRRLIGDNTWKKINHSAYNCKILANYLCG